MPSWRKRLNSPKPDSKMLCKPVPARPLVSMLRYRAARSPPDQNCVLELIGGAPRMRDHAALAEDDRPGRDRGEQQQCNHRLHDGACIEYHGPDRQVIGHYATP